MNESKLFEAYLSIWNNRKPQKGSNSTEDSLRKLVVVELLDEQTHPRIRKSVEVKFYYAVKRIIESSLNDSEKTALIQYYINVMSEISH
ncbi:hypothetical protein ACQKCU_21055 [Heyndrickxia sporothermodurans]